MKREDRVELVDASDMSAEAGAMGRIVEVWRGPVWPNRTSMRTPVNVEWDRADSRVNGQMDGYYSESLFSVVVELN